MCAFGTGQLEHERYGARDHAAVGIEFSLDRLRTERVCADQMSAIAAIFHRDGGAVPRAHIERVGRALKPYGPDLQAVALRGETAFACAMGHYLPEDIGQSQPVNGGDGRFTMLFDGRIDNRDEIITALDIAPAQAARMPDAVLAMRSYERWGVESFTRWVADFALIVWDENEHRLTLARDPFGSRTLLYHDTPERFVVATMPQGLHALPDIPLEVDEQKIADALCGLLNDTERTFYRDISICPAAHYMTIDRHGSRTQRYYQFADHVRDIRYPKDEDYVDAARELFRTAIAARLRSPGGVGMFMSGGLDSSTCAVFAAEQLALRGQKLPVFTHVPDIGWDGLTEAHCYADETPYVEAIAQRHPQLALNIVRSDGRTHYHQQDPYLRLSGMPVRGAGADHFFHAVLEAARAQHVRVMLIGSAGNATLSYTGEGLYYELWKSGQLAALFSELRHDDPHLGAMLRRFRATVVPGLGSGRIWEFTQRLRGRQDEDPRWYRHGAVRREFGEEMDLDARARDTAIPYSGIPAGPNRRFWQWRANRVPRGGVGQWGPAMKALYHTEIRDPFGDRRLLEWCFGVPETQFRRKGVRRWLIKRMMQGVLPDEVLNKPRDVGRVNADWHFRMTKDLDRMKADLATMAQDDDLARMIDIPRLQALLDDWPKQTVVGSGDDRSFYLPGKIPMAMQIGRFVQLTKGTNA